MADRTHQPFRARRSRGMTPAGRAALRLLVQMIATRRARG
jgi:hypothetical protein